MDLIADDDLLSTVEAALAFIDACVESGEVSATELEASGESHDAATASGELDATRSQLSDAVIGPDVPAPSLQQKRTRNAVASSRSRKKRQTELLVLREEEAVLRSRLQALTERKRASDQLTVGPPTATALRSTTPNASCLADASEAAELADHAHRERQRAEALNRRLRAALRKQRSVTQHLSQLVEKRLVLKEVADLLDTASMGSRSLSGWPAMDPRSGFIADEKHLIVADLTQRLGPQVVSVDMAIGSLGSVPNESMEFVSRTRQCVMGGYVVELSSTTPLSSSVSEAWRSLSAFVTGVQAEAAYHNSEKRAIGEHTYKKEYSMAFEDPGQLGRVVVDDISLVQEVASQTYRAFLWSALVRPQCGRFRIRVNGWVALSKSSNSTERCVYRQQIEICVEPADSPGAITTLSELDESGRHLQDFVMASMTTKIQRNQRRLSDAMLRKHGGGLPSFMWPPEHR